MMLLMGPLGAGMTPGMELIIPPVDGLTYVWKEGDTLDAVADKFKSDVNKDKTLDEKDAELIREAIVSWPSNDLDLTIPEPPAPTDGVERGRIDLADVDRYLDSLGGK